MILTFLKNAMSLGIVIVLWIVYSIGYLPFAQALDVLTVVVFITVLALAIEDIATKVLSNRKFITWQYVVLMAFVLTSDFLWMFLGACTTFLQLFIRLVLLLIACAGTFAWGWFAYRVSVMTDEERSIMAKKLAYRKLARKFSKMSDTEVKEALEKALFCHLQDDCLEGSLLVSQPFTPEYATLRELVEANNGADNGTAISLINGYIGKLISNRKEKDVKEKN